MSAVCLPLWLVGTTALISILQGCGSSGDSSSPTADGSSTNGSTTSDDGTGDTQRVQATCFQRSCSIVPGVDIPCDHPGATAAYTTAILASEENCSQDGTTWDPYFGRCVHVASSKCFRGCYPRSTCNADYAAAFDGDGCIPNGFKTYNNEDAKCEPPAVLNGWGARGNAWRQGPLRDGEAPKNFNPAPWVNNFYYGVTSYVRLWRPLAKREGFKNFGPWGQWIQAFGKTPDNKPLGSIEGGIFASDKVGLTYYPKYLAGSSTHGYSPMSDTSGGWGFNERLTPCQFLGRVVMTNRMLIPPSGLSFEPLQDAKDGDGGVFIGAGWVALPFFGGKIRDDLAGEEILAPENLTDDGGKLTWSFFLDSSNAQGPILMIVPEFFYRRAAEFDAMRVSEGAWAADTWNYTEAFLKSLGRMPAHWSPGMGSEIHNLPTVFTEGTAPYPDFDSGAGPKYWKAPEIMYPNQSRREPLLKDLRTYSTETYNSLVALFDNVQSTEQDYQDAHSEMSGAYIMFSNPSMRHVMQKYDGSARVEIEPAAEVKAELGEDNLTLFVYWGNESYPQRYSRYYETVPYETTADGSPTGGKDWRNYGSGTTYIARPVYDEEQIPDSLRETEYAGKTEGAANYRRHNSTEYSSHWCFDCTSADATCGQDEQITLEDGAIVEYRWYRWRDQPALKVMAQEFPDIYTDSYLDELQAKVEKMHSAGWFSSSSQSFMKRPTNTHLGEVERALVMTPPSGKETGWVPIALGQHYPENLPSYDGGIMYQGQQTMY